MSLYKNDSGPCQMQLFREHENHSMSIIDAWSCWGVYQSILDNNTVSFGRRGYPLSLCSWGAKNDSRELTIPPGYLGIYDEEFHSVPFATEDDIQISIWAWLLYFLVTLWINHEVLIIGVTEIHPRLLCSKVYFRQESSWFILQHDHN